MPKFKGRTTSRGEWSEENIKGQFKTFLIVRCPREQPQKDKKFHALHSRIVLRLYNRVKRLFSSH
jgi:hypothetical protein